VRRLTRTFWSIAIVALLHSGAALAQGADVVVLRGIVSPTVIGPDRPFCLSSEKTISLAGYYEMHFRLPRGMSAPRFLDTRGGRAERQVFERDRYLHFRCNIAPIGAGLAVYPAMPHTADRARLLTQVVCRALERGEMFGFELTTPNSTETRLIFLTASPD